MNPARLRHPVDLRGSPLARRAASLGLVLAVHALLLFLLLELAPPLAPLPGGRGIPLTVRLLPDALTAAEQTQTSVEARQADNVEPLPIPVTQQPIAPDPPISDVWSRVIPLTRNEMAAADVGKFRTSASDRAPGNGSAGGEADGGGPGGERLYNAEWYRRPTQAELAGYLPAGAPRSGWGMIACRTVANFRVEDCQEIGQFPAGSGFAGAIRQAAWQFRVLPPRIGGRPVIGAWVRIRIDYTAEEVRVR